MAGDSRLQLQNLRGVRAGEIEAYTVEVHGNLDATTLGQFTRGMDAVVAKGKPNIVLDCHKVSYVNSTGMGTLLKYADKLRSLGGELILIEVPERVLMVMEMLGFQKSLAVAANLGAAVEHMKNR